MIEIEAPDGAIVEFPDGTPDAVIEKAMQDAYGAPQAAPPAAPQGPAGVTGIGLVDAGLTGLRQGAEGLGGMFGDANQMQGDLAGWAAGKFGASPETQETASKFGRRLSMMPMAPTTEEIQKDLTKPVFGEHYQPKTVGEEYMRTAGQFAPGAIAGPGGLMRKAVMTAVPAVLSETAGQATKGTAAEPYARGVAALVGGVAASGRNANRVKPPKAAETIEALGAQVDDFYERSRQAGITVKADAFERVANNAEFAAGRLNEKLRPKTMGAIEEVMALRGKDISLEELDELRQTVGNAMEGAAKQDIRTLTRVKKVIDSFTDNPKAGDFTGDVKGFELIKEGRKLAAKKMQLETVEKYVNRGEGIAASQVNADTAGVTKKQLKNLMLNEGKTRGFSPAQMKQLKKAAGYTVPQKFLHAASGLLPRDKLTSAVHLAAGASTATATGGASIPFQIGLMGVGFGAQKAVAALSRKSVDELTNMIANGDVPAPVTQQVLQLLAKSKREALVRSLLAARSGEVSAKSNSSLR